MNKDELLKAIRDRCEQVKSNHKASSDAYYDGWHDGRLELANELLNLIGQSDWLDGQARSKVREIETRCKRSIAMTQPRHTDGFSF